MLNEITNFRCIFYVILLFSVLKFQAQTKIERINTLIEQDSLNQAESIIKSDVEELKENKNYHELVYYIFPLGKISIIRDNFNKAESDSKDLLLYIEKSTSNSETLHLANIEFSKLCLDIGNLPEAYNYGEKAKAHALKYNDATSLLNSAYYLADYGMKLGQVELLDTHIRKADSIIVNNPNSRFKITARVYNLFGALMFFTSKQDSAIYYFEKALKHIPNLEQNEENKLYLPSAIKGNMSLIKLNQGKPTEAKFLIQSSIQLAKKFLEKTKNHPLENRVKRNLMIGYSNLNGLYYDLGDFEKSDFITKIAFDYTKKNFPENSQEYFMASLSVAEVKIQRRDFEEAIYYLDNASTSLEKIVGDNFQLKAFLYNEYANIYHLTNEFDKALEYRELSDLNYSKSNPNAYDSNKLYNTMNLALAYSKFGDKEKAINTVQDAYDYFYKTKGEKDYFTNALMLTFAKVYFNLKMYKESLMWTNKSLIIYSKNDSDKTIDKVYFEEDKAEIYIINAQSKFHLSETKDSIFLKDILSDVDNAIKAIEEKKISINSFKDISTLIEDNTTVFDFAKKINLELYDLTNNTSYLDKTISLHESALYNRIRARLNTKPNISFSNIPKHIADRENELRTLQNNKEANFELLMLNNDTWHNFLDTLKTAYPKYYKMRYATIEKPLDSIYKKIPKNTTAIRYLFIKESLYGVVITANDKYILKLDAKNVLAYISQLSIDQSNIETTSLKLYELYKQLWKPIENKINTENIIIIPDGELFNLSFESLTPKRISSFKEIATNSLLAKHTISYNYSLLLLDKAKKIIDYKNDFVAFAPEFNTKMKEEYSLAITDSLSIDKTYLSLLPQPFSVDLAKEYSRLFNGDFFINERASKQIFTNEANEHKIIHIGTHAESNNITPELSRLIFAKNSSDEDNSLYTYEIYNQNLNSNLAILTACETGKPTYQAGEGMISLAHAFNYAGSESILTSLWKIDEQSSAKIIDLFYKNISNGLAKDKALKKAKLDYISLAEGRTVSPQYWAGLVLIGDTSPIELQTSTNILWYLLSALLVILATIFIIKTRKK